MDKIIMKNLSFYGYHGVMQEEKVLGQKFILDIQIYTDLRKAGKTDEVNDTINYSKVYDEVKYIVEKKTFDLIEALAESIADTILNEFIKAKEVVIKVKKPEAPVKGIYDYFAVEIRRTKNE